MRRLVVGSVLVVVMATPASADVTVDNRVVAAGSEQELTFSVPDEYDAPGAVMTYVQIDFPEGFFLVECVPLEDWGCSADRTVRRATFQRTPSSVRDDGDESRLGVRVRPPSSAGRYAIQVKQWYKSGEFVAWNGPIGGARPAPVVEVTGSAPATTVGPADETSHTTPPVRRLVSPRFRTRSTESQVGGYLAAALLSSIAFVLWWRRRWPASRRS